MMFKILFSEKINDVTKSADFSLLTVEYKFLCYGQFRVGLVHYDREFIRVMVSFALVPLGLRTEWLAHAVSDAIFDLRKRFAPNSCLNSLDSDMVLSNDENLPWEEALSWTETKTEDVGVAFSGSHFQCLCESSGLDGKVEMKGRKKNA